MNERRILDFRAGVPWSDQALDVLARTSRSAWGNPAHPSSEGRRAATWLEAAQATLRGLTGLPHVDFFADRNAAVAAAVAHHPGARIAVAATHRKAVLRIAHVVAPVDAGGMPDWPECDLAIVQGANEETGVSDRGPSTGVRVLDATNSFGRVSGLLDADHVIADASAWGAPGGIAMVLGRAPLEAYEIPPLPLVAVAVHRLAEHWQARDLQEAAEREAMDALEARVLAEIPDVQFHGVGRVAHIRSFSILHLDAETLTRALDVEGFVVGSGSACVSDGTPSHVLAAMGRVTHGNVRLALPVDLDLAVLDEFAGVLAHTVRRLRAEAGVADL